jgi:hypothetical protein
MLTDSNITAAFSNSGTFSTNFILNLFLDIEPAEEGKQHSNI